jgi:hypothetical protein
LRDKARCEGKLTCSVIMAEVLVNKEELIHPKMPIPLRILATLPRDIMSDATLEIKKNKITYGQAAGLCFFTDYHDRRD